MFFYYLLWLTPYALACLVFVLSLAVAAIQVGNPQWLGLTQRDAEWLRVLGAFLAPLAGVLPAVSQIQQLFDRLNTRMAREALPDPEPTPEGSVHEQP